MFNIAASTSPLSESEVDIIKRQHDKKDWGYKCNDVIPACVIYVIKNYVEGAESLE